jgi:hypothetical protein
MKKLGNVRPSGVLAVVAIVLAMGGSAIAGSAVTGKDIKNNSITGKDVKESTLKIEGAEGPQGPQGPAGEDGVDGTDGIDGEDAAKAFATVDVDGNLITARSSGVSSVTKTATGAYRVFFPSVAGCNAVASSMDAGIARVRAIDDAGAANPNSVLVNTYSLVDGSSYTTNTIQDRAFTLQHAC